MRLQALAVGVAMAASMSAGAALAACDAGEMVIKFSHVVAETHPKGAAAAKLAERVNAEMNGKACMEVFPNSTLYDDDKVMEAMLLGDVHLAAPSLSKFEAYTLKFRLFDLPFLFSNLSKVNEFTQSEAGKSLLKATESEGYTGLAYLLSGMKYFSANKPLIQPTDASGLKFRVQTSDVAVAMIEALGGSAQKLAFKEVYGALQTGVVDGQENSWCNIYTQKFFEVQDGITETNHQMLAYMVVTSTEWLESLESDVRDQFMTILEQVVAESNDNVAAKEAECRQSILDAGATIRELTPEQRAAWVEAMKPVWQKFEGDIGASLIEDAVAVND